MRYILALLLPLFLWANSYNFDEYKYISAASTEFKKSGNISFEKNKTTITYDKPQYKQIVLDGEEITIQGASGDIIKLKGKALFFTKMYITTIAKLDNFDELKTNRDFDVKKDANLYILSFKNGLKEQILKAKILTKDSKVLSFKLFIKNGDTLEIVKK